MERDAIVDGRYRVKHRVGAGGMAEVWCAEDLQLGRKVALKLLYPRFAEDDDFVERFRREASAAAGLQHQNVVSVYDRGETDDTSYIAMEFVDGRTLKELVQDRGPLPPEQAADLIVQVLRAARFAHKRGIVHRDLKPQNVIVEEEPPVLRAKVTDFGIARAGASDMTETGSIMGTAQYLSPEQAQGLTVSAQSDLYSVGIMLYELLTGRVPFAADSAVAIALKQVSEAPVPPSQLNPAVPPELEAIVLRALEKEPARRFADADEFIAALEHVIRAGAPPTGATVSGAVAPPPPPTQVTGDSGYVFPAAPLGPPPQRAARERSVQDDGGNGRWWLALLAALVVVALVVGGLLLFSAKKVTVPSVVGAPQAEAELTLKDKGFSTDTVPKPSGSPQGTVIGQDPGGGERVKQDTTVTLTISAGPGLATIPDVSGLGRRAARKQLTALGFAVKETTQMSDAVPRDHVIETLPAKGQRLTKGMVVTLVVSTGPQSVKVPDVVGQSETDATQALRDAGFEVRTTEQEDATADPGTVLSQAPAKGATVAKGSTVTLTLAKAPTQAAIPDTVGQSSAAAAAAISGAGFQVEEKTQQVEDPKQDGKVLKQSPPGGAGKAKKGATVTITVGSFDQSQIIPTTPGGTSGPSGTT